MMVQQVAAQFPWLPHRRLARPVESCRGCLHNSPVTTHRSARLGPGTSGPEKVSVPPDRAGFGRTIRIRRSLHRSRPVGLIRSVGPTSVRGRRGDPVREVPTKSMTENPPYTITSNILDLVERIGETIGRVEEAAASTDMRLRRINRIRTIRGSLAIEGNRPSEEQVSALLDGKPFITFMLETIFKAIRHLQTSDHAGDQVTDQVVHLLASLQEGPKTATELMAGLGLSHRPTFGNNYVRPAIASALVETTRPESPTAKNQKHRLTARAGGSTIKRNAAPHIGELVWTTNRSRLKLRGRLPVPHEIEEELNRRSAGSNRP